MAKHNQSDYSFTAGLVCLRRHHRLRERGVRLRVSLRKLELLSQRDWASKTEQGEDHARSDRNGSRVQCPVFDCEGFSGMHSFPGWTIMRPARSTEKSIA